MTQDPYFTTYFGVHLRSRRVFTHLFHKCVHNYFTIVLSSQVWKSAFYSFKIIDYISYTPLPTHLSKTNSNNVLHTYIIRYNIWNLYKSETNGQLIKVQFLSKVKCFPSIVPRHSRLVFLDPNRPLGLFQN